MATQPSDLPERPGTTATEWARSPERGSVWLLRVMTYASLRLGRPFGRVILYFIATYFFLFAPTARQHSCRYLRRVLGREPTARDRFRQVFYFASIILDRLYLVHGRFELFDVSIEGEELMRARLQAGQGAFLMGSHLGSFEMLSAVGRQQPGLRVAMAMYEENARKVNAMMTAVGAPNPPEIIALGHLDAMLRIRERLDQGFFVGMLGDRTLTDQPAQAVNFLGHPALFPLGAMRLAALLRRPVIFMTGLYRGGNRYHVVFRELADFSNLGPGQRETAVRSAIERYAALLEECCRSDPYNWFNFYDFWQGAGAEPKHD